MVKISMKELIRMIDSEIYDFDIFEYEGKTIATYSQNGFLNAIEYGINSYSYTVYEVI